MQDLSFGTLHKSKKWPDYPFILMGTLGWLQKVGNKRPKILY